jgi:IS5 family transposase
LNLSDPGVEEAVYESAALRRFVGVHLGVAPAPYETTVLRFRHLRQYFPKKTDLSGYSQADLDKVALRLNQRPRKTLGFETPASKLQASVASTG